MTRLLRRGQPVVAALSVGVAAATVALVRPGDAVAAGLIVLAVVWGAAPFAADVLFGNPPGVAPPAEDAATVTTIVCAGAEPSDIAHASIVLAAQAGPTMVATTTSGDVLPDMRHLDVPVHVGPSIEAALLDAVASVHSHAVLIVSASAFPAPACAEVAGRLRGDVAWAVGQVAAFNDDSYAPNGRALTAGRLRSRARAGGLTTWEPDATIVRTDLLRGLSSEPGRPRGTWLRALSSRGYRGVEDSRVVARRAAPTDGPLFWPSEAMRRRAAAADLSAAMHTGSSRVRLLAVVGLARELYAYQLLLWLSAPILIAWSGSFPFRCSPGAFFLAHGTLAVARWATAQSAAGGFRPLEDMRAAAYDAPGSLLALPSAIARRIQPLRFRFPEQPLLLAAIALTLVCTVPLLDRPPTTEAAVDGAVGLTLMSLVALWVCAIHAVGPRAWERTAYRLDVDVPATVNEQDSRLLDASPVGAAVRVPCTDLHVGDAVSISVAFPPRGTTLMVSGVVAARRVVHHESVMGIALKLDSAQRADWIRAVFAASSPAASDTQLQATRSRARPYRAALPDLTPTRIARHLRRVQVAIVGCISVAVVAALALVVLGYRPLVVRSGSMTPALALGDIAVVDWVEAQDVAVGDIISFDYAELDGENVTHRVRGVKADGSTRSFETRGDANNASEFWSAPADELVGRVVIRLPGIGKGVSALGRPGVRWALLGAAPSLALCALLIGRRRFPAVHQPHDGGAQLDCFESIEHPALSRTPVDRFGG